MAVRYPAELAKYFPIGSVGDQLFIYVYFNGFNTLFELLIQTRLSES